MAWYVVHVGHVPGIYQTWENCYAQVNHYPANSYKKYNTEAEALRAYYGHPA
jgi:ribonuclease HI